MSKNQYSPRKQKREKTKTKVEGEHSKVPEKTPEVKKEGEKVEKEGAWSDWQWVNEGWYYYRARRGESGKWQYEFEIPETIAPQSNSPASAPAIEDKGGSKDDSVKPLEIAVQDFSTSTDGNDEGGYAGIVDGPIYNWSFIPYTEGFVDNGEQITPSSTTEVESKSSNQVVKDSKVVKEDVKEPAAAKPDEKAVKVVRRGRGRGRGRGRERKKAFVTEWRDAVDKEAGSRGSDKEVDKQGSAWKSRKGREKDRHRDRSYYNKPPYSDYYTLSD